jgi:hypothetical protein
LIYAVGFQGQASMSAQFYKIFSGVFLAHLIVLSVVWVGFSAPLPRPPAIFTYEGALPAEDTSSGAGEVWQKAKTTEQFILDHSENSYFNHWIELRDPSKPVIKSHP